MARRTEQGDLAVLPGADQVTPPMPRPGRGWRLKRRGLRRVVVPDLSLDVVDLAVASREVERRMVDGLPALDGAASHGAFVDRIVADWAAWKADEVHQEYERRLTALDGVHRDAGAALSAFADRETELRQRLAAQVSVRDAAWAALTAADVDPAGTPVPATATSDELAATVLAPPSTRTSEPVPGTGRADRPRA